jgi:hypothetical protein
MIKYRIIQKDIVADAMDELEASEILQMFIANNPDKKYCTEEYEWINPEGKRYGRNPDLH